VKAIEMKTIMNLKRTVSAVVLSVALAGMTSRAEDTTNEIQALKEQIERLGKQVQDLEQKQKQKEDQDRAADKAAADAREKQIQDLDQQVKILERQREVDAETAEAKAKEAAKSAAVVSVGVNGLNVRSADTNFAFALHGLLQIDSRMFFDNGGIMGVDGFILRRARPILSGTVFRDFDFMFVPDFGGNTVQIQDAFVNYHYSPEVQLQAGKFKAPVGLELLQSDSFSFFNERALATDLVPNRQVGLELHGDITGGVISYAGGIFNSTTDYNGTTTNANYDNNPAFIGRLFLMPFRQTSITALKGFGFGVGGSYEIDQAWTNTASTALTPGFNTDGQQRFFAYTNGVVGNGTHWRVSPQGYYYLGPLGIIGEYVISDQEVVNVPKGLKADLQNTAWEVSGGWVLTGEDASYTGIIPKRPFDPFKGDWGAFQVVGRYAELSVDPATFPNFANPNNSASDAKSWSAGLNWFLNRNIRLNASYAYTRFTGGNGPGATVTAQPEKVFFTRVQLAF
jgi:phosphate-selective porin OprO/OprP